MSDPVSPDQGGADQGAEGEGAARGEFVVSVLAVRREAAERRSLRTRHAGDRRSIEACTAFGVADAGDYALGISKSSQPRGLISYIRVELIRA